MNSQELYHRIQEIVAGFVPIGVERGVDVVSPDLERRVRLLAEEEVQFRNATLPIQIEQAYAKVKAIEEHRENLLAERNRIRMAQIDGEGKFSWWSTKIGWGALVLAELVLFPWVLQEALGFPIYSGILYGFVFFAISLVAKGFYTSLNASDRERFFRFLVNAVKASLPVFVICVTSSRVLNIAASQPNFQLQPSGFGAVFSLTGWQWGTLIGLWVLGASSGCVLACVSSRYRNPDAKLRLIDKGLRQTEKELCKATDDYTGPLREKQEIEGLVENSILAAKSMLNAVVLYERERKERLQKMCPSYFSPPQILPESSDGKATAARLGTTVAVALLLLFSPMIAFADLQVFVVQDITRPAEAVDRDFECFARTAWAMPSGELTLWRSDGIEYVRGTIEKTYSGKMQRQRQEILNQGRAFYLKLKGHPGKIRDYPTVLSEILSRPTGAADQILLIILGSPLYSLGSVDWNSRVPSLSWAWHTASPFGEKSLLPAQARFKAAMIFRTEDFVTPGHRLALQKWWAVFFQRINGSLILFTADAEALSEIISRIDSIPDRPRGELLDIPPAERNAPLRLEEVRPLGITR
jgi:hypothetical protein